MTELIQEIYGTIMRNKLRTLLTGFSVAWGIFMLIVLLGAGNGLIHAFENQSKGMIMNSMKIYPGTTSQPYKGMKEGRGIYLKESDRELTATSFPDHIITPVRLSVKEMSFLLTEKKLSASESTEFFLIILHLKLSKLKKDVSLTHATWRSDERLSYYMKKR